MSLETENYGARIRALRDLFGYTQIELARRVDITQGHLSKVERGIVPADLDLLDRIAEKTATPRSFLDVEALGVDEGTLRFRKQAKARARDTKQVTQLLLEVYRACSELGSAERLPPPGLPVAESQQLDANAIEELASKARASLSISDDSVIGHVTRVLERAGIFVIPITPPGAKPDEETVGHFGASTWRGPWDSALVGYFPSPAGDRQRITLAHELGHLILHQQRAPSHAVAENEAMYFAGAFLVPPYNMRAALSRGPVTLSRLQAMKAGWGVSIQALIMRAYNLGLIDEERKQSLFVQLTVRGWRKSEPVKVHPERPVLLYKLLAVRFGEPVDWSRAAHSLGLPEQILRPVAPEPGV